MITVFSGTNRRNSNTRKISEQVYNLFQTYSSEPVKFFSLEDLPDDILHVDMYGAEKQSAKLAAIQDEFFIPANKLYFVIPEYNGSFPGALKLFIDACSVRAYKETFHGAKKAGLLGLASGRAGNLRGLEHFAGVLNYLHITVMPPHQPLAAVESLLDENGIIKDETALKQLEAHVRKFIAF